MMCFLCFCDAKGNKFCQTCSDALKTIFAECRQASYCSTCGFYNLTDEWYEKIYVVRPMNRIMIEAQFILIRHLDGHCPLCAPHLPFVADNIPLYID